MPITSASTLDEIYAEYIDNIGYDDGAGDVASAELFKKACRALIPKCPARIKHGTGEVELDVTFIQNQLKEVMAWLSRNSSTSSVGPKGYAKGVSFAADFKARCLFFALDLCVSRATAHFNEYERPNLEWFRQ